MRDKKTIESEIECHEGNIFYWNESMRLSEKKIRQFEQKLCELKKELEGIKKVECSRIARFGDVYKFYDCGYWSNRVILYDQSGKLGTFLSEWSGNGRCINDDFQSWINKGEYIYVRNIFDTTS